MGMRIDVTEGWTGPLDFALMADGAPLNLSGLTIELVLRDRDDALITTTGWAATFGAPTEGRVRVSPTADALVHAVTPHRAHFKITDGGGKVVFFPGGDADYWVVNRA
jgi:hypothetical protein